MAKRKISVEEAFAVLEAAGINVQVKSIAPESPAAGTPQVVDTTPKRNAYGSTETTYRKRPVTHVKIPLYAKHSRGSGGVTVTDSNGEQHVENAGVVTYGPGVTLVPVELAAELERADAAARQADEDMLSPVPKHRLIVPKVDSGGNRFNVGVLVPEEMLDPGAMLTQLPTQYTYRI